MPAVASPAKAAAKPHVIIHQKLPRNGYTRVVQGKNAFMVRTKGGKVVSVRQTSGGKHLSSANLPIARQKVADECLVCFYDDYGNYICVYDPDC